MILELNSQSTAIIHLRSSDSKISKLIGKVGDYSLEINTNYYIKLVSSIVGQQLSIKAKETIWNRIETLCGSINPENILNIDDCCLRNAGVSHAKINYIKGLSQKIVSKEIELESLCSLNDDDVIEILTSIRGIGKWTAEMFLIFSLGRPDVLSFDDVGIKRAMKWLYDLEDTPSPFEIEKISDPWKPYRSIASLYLWEVINLGLINENTNIL